MRIKAAVAYEGEELFRLEILELDEPRADEVRVKIAGVGICHSDLVFKSGAREYSHPVVFGHEGSGIVEAVGSAVTKVIPGDKVVLTFHSCGSCDHCGADEPAYCESFVPLNFVGRRPDGTTSLRNAKGDVISNFFGQSSFATHALAYERNVIKLDADVPLELMGPLGCGVQTGAGAVLRALDVRNGATILITGGGTVGLSAVMAAAIRECKIIIVVEPMRARRDLAMSFGATHTIDPANSENIADEIREIVPNGVDYAVDASGVVDVVKAAISVLRQKGTCALVGVSMPGANIPAEMNEVMMSGKTIRGVVEGDSDPDTFIPEIVEHYLADRLPFNKMVKTFSLDQINEAVAALKRGECTKAVLLPDELVT